MNRAGNQQTQLTNTPVVEARPKLSPGGMQVVFERFSTDFSTFPFITLWVMNADGSNQHEVSPPPLQFVVPADPPFTITDFVVADFDPAWSPNGTMITFVRDGDLQSGVYTMNADGSGLAGFVTGPESRFSTPAWAPGPGIAYAYDFIGVAGTFILGPFGNTGELTGPFPHNPFLSGGGESQPAWSPDGTRMAFSGPGSGINIAATTGSVTPTFITPGDSPSFSPEGQEIAFARDGSVWTMKADGTQQVELAVGGEPNWAPQK